MRLIPFWLVAKRRRAGLRARRARLFADEHRERRIALAIMLATGVPLAAVLLLWWFPIRRTRFAVERCARTAVVDEYGLAVLDERIAAEEIAALGGGAQAPRRLHTYLRDPRVNATHRWAAIAMIGRCGAQAEWLVPELSGILVSDTAEERERRVAGRAIARIGGRRAAWLLSLAMRDRCWEVRLLAEESLERMRGGELTPVLIDNLSCDDSYVRMRSARLLGRRGDARTLAALERALASERDWCVAAAIRSAIEDLRGRYANGGREVAAR